MGGRGKDRGQEGKGNGKERKERKGKKRNGERNIGKSDATRGGNWERKTEGRKGKVEGKTKGGQWEGGRTNGRGMECGRQTNFDHNYYKYHIE